MALDVGQINQKLSNLKTRFEPEHRMMRRLDAWRYLLHDKIEQELWGDVEEDKRGETIAKPEINAVTDTLVAITSSKDPSIQIKQRNALGDRAASEANLNERIGHGIFHEVNKYRDESLLSEGPEWMFHRGKAILKILWLSPEERGEVRRDVPLVMREDGQPLTDDGQDITNDGAFPVYMTFIDPLECFYTINPLTRHVSMMIHEYYDTWDSITAMFPDITEDPEFKMDPNALNTPIKVIDYWDEEVNAVVINGKFYKQPTPHDYPWVPFVVQAGRTRRRHQDNALPFIESVPFCDPMFKAVRDLSWALSVLATYMKTLGFATLIHYGIPTDGSSPWFSARRDATTGAIEDMDYQLVLTHDPNGQIIPAFVHPQTGVQERLEYLRPPEMVTHWQAFAAERNADVEVVSFGRAFLSGVMTADLSGYSVSLQRQLSMARIEPYILGLNRLFSRALQMVFDLIARELRNEGRADVPLLIQGLVNEPDQQITAELAEQVRVVDFQFRPELPSDREADEGLIMQQVQAGLLSPVKAIDLIGRVQDARDEFEDILSQQDMMTNPVARLALLSKKMMENGYISEQDQFHQQLQAQAQALSNQRAQQQQMDMAMTMAAAQGQMPIEEGTGQQ